MCCTSSLSRNVILVFNKMEWMFPPFERVTSRMCHNLWDIYGAHLYVYVCLWTVRMCVIVILVTCECTHVDQILCVSRVACVRVSACRSYHVCFTNHVTCVCLHMGHTMCVLYNMCVFAFTSFHMYVTNSVQQAGNCNVKFKNSFNTHFSTMWSHLL